MERFPCSQKYLFCLGPELYIENGMPVLVCGLDGDDGYCELVRHCHANMGKLAPLALRRLMEISKNASSGGGISDT